MSSYAIRIYMSLIKFWQLHKLRGRPPGTSGSGGGGLKTMKIRKNARGRMGDFAVSDQFTVYLVGPPPVRTGSQFR